ncbi:MAG TPA: cupin domain-containing protein [Gemmatimonadales bacterium]|nr:cupin domain-containing protein [Gemmatimonadales bacterium]
MTEVNLGPAVRRLRERRQLSLRALAEATGFSPGFISQVENGQASPSIASMERIAAALEVSLVEFFMEAQTRRSSVTRADARPVLSSQWSRARIESLGSGLEGQHLAPMLVTLEPGGSSGKHPHASRTEEFALVQEGTVELSLEGRQQTLSAGDAVTIRSGALRRWHNSGEQPARVLIVAAGPDAGDAERSAGV